MTLRKPFRSDPPWPARLPTSSPEPTPRAEPPKGLSGHVLRAAVERALAVQQPAVAEQIAKVRRERPSATPAEVVLALNKLYLVTVGGTGAAAGGLAFVPGIGTTASLATGAAEAIAALDASVLYTLAVAEVHGLPMRELERRRALVLAIVLGEGGSRLMRKVTGGSPHWARQLADGLPLRRLGPIDQTLVRWFVRRWALRQATLAFGRALPFGVGAVIGATGNVAIAWAVIHSTEEAFGPPPTRWPQALPPAGR